jgi:plasmid stabilization system protein ParE
MSAKRVEFHEGAIANVKNAVSWYSERSTKAAADFIKELKQATDAIRRHPDRWPMGKNNTRRFLLWRFPFTVIYSQAESVITVWAVAHASRRPDYWKSRAK